MRVLDVGCGIGEPARRIASRVDCEIVGLNIGCGQVRQGRELIARAGLAARVDIRHGNALHMPLPDGGFDAAICLEAAGDICVRAADKPRLLAELRRVLRPGGQVGFSDLVFDPATDRGRAGTRGQADGGGGGGAAGEAPRSPRRSVLVGADGSRVFVQSLISSRLRVSGLARPPANPQAENHA